MASLPPDSEMATACDLLGKRWALQVVRELALGPRRFTDLHHSLTGISTNALAARLRELQRVQVVRRRLLPPPAAAAVYELAEGGTELGEIVVALDRWGARSLAPATQDAANRRSARDLPSAGQVSAAVDRTAIGPCA
jgi:DNA-binding HxlR family transcriptional regulator